MSTDLVTFLLARLDEDEATLRQPPGPHSDYHGSDPYGAFSPSCPACLAGWPGRRRALAEVEAKRRIVNLHRPEVFEDEPAEAFCTHDQRTSGLWPCPTMRLLALPYADHPDYDETWRP